jgi:hypothetical protein
MRQVPLGYADFDHNHQFLAESGDVAALNSTTQAGSMAEAPQLKDAVASTNKAARG